MTNQASVEMLCSRAKVELVFLLAHQRHPKTGSGVDWSLLPDAGTGSLARERVRSI